MKQPRPLWLKIAVILCMLPVLAFPSMLGLCPTDSPLRAMLWFYPLYVVAAGVCAWMCWPERRDLCVILLILLLLSHAALWYGLLCL